MEDMKVSVTRGLGFHGDERIWVFMEGSRWLRRVHGGWERFTTAVRKVHDSCEKGSHFKLQHQHVDSLALENDIFSTCLDTRFLTPKASLEIQKRFHHFLRCLGNCKSASISRDSSSKPTFPQSHKLELLRLLKSILQKPQICFQLYPFFLLCFLPRFSFVSLLLATVQFLKVRETRFFFTPFDFYIILKNIYN